MSIENTGQRAAPKALAAMIAFTVPQAVPADAREHVQDQRAAHTEMKEDKRAADADYHAWRELMLEEARGAFPSRERKALEEKYGQTTVLGWINRFYVTDAEFSKSREADKTLFWEAGEKFIRLLKYRDSVLTTYVPYEIRAEVTRLFAENAGSSEQAPELVMEHWHERVSVLYGEYRNIFVAALALLENEIDHDPNFYTTSQAQDYANIRDIFAHRVPETQRISPVRAHAEDLNKLLDQFFGLTENQRLELMYRGQLEAVTR